MLSFHNSTESQSCWNLIFLLQPLRRMRLHIHLSPLYSIGPAQMLSTCYFHLDYKVLSSSRRAMWPKCPLPRSGDTRRTRGTSATKESTAIESRYTWRVIGWYPTNTFVIIKTMSRLQITRLRSSRIHCADNEDEWPAIIPSALISLDYIGIEVADFCNILDGTDIKTQDSVKTKSGLRMFPLK